MIQIMSSILDQITQLKQEMESLRLAVVQVNVSNLGRQKTEEAYTITRRAAAEIGKEMK